MLQTRSKQSRSESEIPRIQCVEKFALHVEILNTKFHLGKFLSDPGPQPALSCCNFG